VLYKSTINTDIEITVTDGFCAICSSHALLKSRIVLHFWCQHSRKTLYCKYTARGWKRCY